MLEREKGFERKRGKIAREFRNTHHSKQTTSASAIKSPHAPSTTTARRLLVGARVSEMSTRGGEGTRRAPARTTLSLCGRRHVFAYGSPPRSTDVVWSRCRRPRQDAGEVGCRDFWPCRLPIVADVNVHLAALWPPEGSDSRLLRSAARTPPAVFCQRSVHLTRHRGSLRRRPQTFEWEMERWS